MPRILAASGESDAKKHERVEEQPRWVDADGVLAPALAFLQKL